MAFIFGAAAEGKNVFFSFSDTRAQKWLQGQLGMEKR